MSRGSSYDLVKTAEGLLASTQEMTPETAKQILIFIERAFKKGVGEKYNLRAKAHKVLAQTYARTQEPDKAEANRVQYVENADGYLLLEDAKTALATITGTIELETGARILDMLAKAVQRLPENYPNLHAEAYRATAEILEALGDNEHAVEYYEYALLKNPKIGVKRRLDELKNQRSPEQQEVIVQQCIEIIRSEHKASVSLLQRRLHLGYTDAARIMDELENRGIVGPSKGALPRDVNMKFP
jgi:DNA segregation ATPase FtsK/SpoIIIE-like protein